MKLTFRNEIGSESAAAWPSFDDAGTLVDQRGP
jgi:hypothetical protein